MTARLRHRHLARRGALALALALGVAATAAAESTPGTRAGAAPREIKVVRVRPERDRPATLRFLAENRDFLRGRLDALRERPRDARGTGVALDPRWLEWQEMLAAIHAVRDSVSTAGSERRRRDLLADVGELQALEAELDLLERALAGQRERLSVLQAGFAGDQRTALFVVLSGAPAGTAVSEVSVTLEDGGAIALPIDASHATSLGRGALLELFHGRVEPRDQVIRIRIAGDRWPGGDDAFLTLDPPRNRITMLRLDLSGAGPDRGAAGVRATTWLHEPAPPGDEG